MSFTRFLHKLDLSRYAVKHLMTPRNSLFWNLWNTIVVGEDSIFQFLVKKENWNSNAEPLKTIRVISSACNSNERLPDFIAKRIEGFQMRNLSDMDSFEQRDFMYIPNKLIFRMGRPSMKMDFMTSLTNTCLPNLTPSTSTWKAETVDLWLLIVLF